MSHRYIVSIGAPAIAVALMSLAPVPAPGQAPQSTASAAPAKTWAVPRTPDGQPDLQGAWTNATEFAGKAFLTESEATDYEKRVFRNSPR